jgi:hypothetical protein
MQSSSALQCNVVKVVRIKPWYTVVLGMGIEQFRLLVAIQTCRKSMPGPDVDGIEVAGPAGPAGRPGRV